MAKSGLVSTPRNFKLTHFPAPAGLAFHGRIGVPCRLLASQACVPCQFFRKGKSMSQIGFIGLGIMGRPMSRNLMKAGHNIVVYDVVPALADAVIADVAARSEVVITMLPDGPEVEQAVLGPDGVLEGAAAGTIIVDMSSISPMVSQKVAAACAGKGVEFLDAPVSGGEPKAIDGTLAIMVGGRQELFDKVLPILQKLGSSVTLTGAVGAGNVTKLANQ